MDQFIEKVFRKCWKFIKIYVLREKKTVAYLKWIKKNGDQTLRIKYNLSSNSIVFDVGGYKGDWAQQIHNQYNSNIHIFEPVNEYYNQIVTRFSGIDNISVYHFGLSGKTRETQISKLSDGSSVYRHSSIKEEIRLIDICEFVEENSINRIDLVKINIEGGEYELLNRITDCTMVNKIQNIQVQFHDCVSNAKALRNSIREKLKKTHTLTYDYYFIWENWQKKK